MHLARLLQGKATSATVTKGYPARVMGVIFSTDVLVFEDASIVARLRKEFCVGTNTTQGFS